MAIDAVGRVSQSTPTGRGAGRTASTGFHLPLQQPAGPAATAPAAEVALSGMLALQELEQGEVQDREARRRGQDLLTELAALQRAVLAGPGADTASLHRLAALAQSVPQAADPRLRQVVAAIALRSRVELARYPHDNSENIAPPTC